MEDGSRSAVRWLLIHAFLLLAACGGAGNTERTGTGGAPSPPPSIEASARPMPSPPAAAASTAPAPSAEAAPVQLRLQFSANTWVEAVVDGGQRIAELHVAAEEMAVHAEREIVLTIGNVGAVRATLNGQPYELPGESGQVGRNLVIRAPAEP